MLNHRDFLRCVNDQFMQVRNERGELLGCIPRPADNATGIRGNDGVAYLLRVMAVSGICLPNDIDPTNIVPGFISLRSMNETDTKQYSEAGRDPDLALPPTSR